MNLGSMSPGNTRTIVFDAIAGGSFSGSTTITNTATVSSNEIGSRSASAQVVVNVASVQQSYALTITKRVQNISDNSALFGSVSADGGERVRYEIVISTSGSTAAQNNVSVCRTNSPAGRPLAAFLPIFEHSFHYEGKAQCS